MESLSNLEKSDIILERKEYADRLKFYIQKWESEMAEIGQLNEEYPEIKFLEPKRNKEAIKNLKIKLSNYDIYNQKTKCRYCQEFVCVCYEARIETGDQRVSKELQQGNETKSTIRSESMEEVPGTGRDNSDNLGSEEIELPF